MCRASARSQEQLPRGQHGPEERQRELGKQNWLKFQPIFLPWGRDPAFLGLSFLIYQIEVRTAAASSSGCEGFKSCARQSRVWHGAGTQQTATITRPSRL